jgi:hypothetical protein
MHKVFAKFSRIYESRILQQPLRFLVVDITDSDKQLGTSSASGTHKRLDSFGCKSPGLIGRVKDEPKAADAARRRGAEYADHATICFEFDEPGLGRGILTPFVY